MTYLATQEPWAYMDNYWDYGISTCISWPDVRDDSGTRNITRSRHQKIRADLAMDIGDVRGSRSWGSPYVLSSEPETLTETLRAELVSLDAIAQFHTIPQCSSYFRKVSDGPISIRGCKTGCFCLFLFRTTGGFAFRHIPTFCWGLLWLWVSERKVPRKLCPQGPQFSKWSTKWENCFGLGPCGHFERGERGCQYHPVGHDDQFLEQFLHLQEDQEVVSGFARRILTTNLQKLLMMWSHFTSFHMLSYHYRSHPVSKMPRCPVLQTVRPAAGPRPKRKGDVVVKLRISSNSIGA